MLTNKERPLQLVKAKNRGGRSEKSKVDVMRTKVWLTEIMRITNSENINQLGDLLVGVGDVLEKNYDSITLTQSIIFKRINSEKRRLFNAGLKAGVFNEWLLKADLDHMFVDASALMEFREKNSKQASKKEVVLDASILSKLVIVDADKLDLLQINHVLDMSQIGIHLGDLLIHIATELLNKQYAKSQKKITLHNTFIKIDGALDSAGKQAPDKDTRHRLRDYATHKGNFSIEEFENLLNIESKARLISRLPGHKTTNQLYNYANGTNSIAKNLQDIDSLILYYVVFSPFFTSTTADRTSFQVERINEALSHHFISQHLVDVGPPNDKKPNTFIHLWDALDGSMEKVLEVMRTYDPTFTINQYLGEPFKDRCAYLTNKIFENIVPPKHWTIRTQNCIATAYKQGKLAIDLDSITFAICAWRMSHFIGSDQPMFDYIMIGLLDQSITDLSKKYTIDEDIMDYIKEIDQGVISGCHDAIEGLNRSVPFIHAAKMENGKIVLGEKKEQTHDYSLLKERIETLSVSAFIDRKRSGEPYIFKI